MKKSVRFKFNSDRGSIFNPCVYVEDDFRVYCDTLSSIPDYKVTFEGRVIGGTRSGFSDDLCISTCQGIIRSYKKYLMSLYE